MAFHSTSPSSSKKSLDLRPRFSSASGMGPIASIHLPRWSSSDVHMPFLDALPGNATWPLTNWIICSLASQRYSDEICRLRVHAKERIMLVIKIWKDNNKIAYKTSQTPNVHTRAPWSANDYFWRSQVVGLYPITQMSVGPRS